MLSTLEQKKKSGEKKEETINLLVYGTLKKDRYNHYLLEKEGVEFLGGRIIKDYTLYEKWKIPFACKEKGKGIKGELYKVPLKILAPIHYMEIKCGYFYVKQRGFIFYAIKLSDINGNNMTHIGSTY